MLGTYASKNGVLIPKEDAVLPVDHMEFGYGFGVYENVRLRNGAPVLLGEHIDRLLHSASIIRLSHQFEKENIAAWTTELIAANGIETANIKMYLVGGEAPQLFIFLLSPKFLEKKEYREGVAVVTAPYERFLPQAKTLNMLPSYVLYRQAQQVGAFDALLLNHDGEILEGTRSNFFAVRGKTLFTPPEQLVLSGITRAAVIECAKAHGYTVREECIKKDDLWAHDGAFLTNTSHSLVPIRSVDARSFPVIPESTGELRKALRAFLEQTVLV